MNAEVRDWPRSAFEAPALRTLDERARAELMRAGRLVRFDDGETVYRAGDSGDSFFVVLAGEVGVGAVRRGDEHESELRRARRGDSFGEEAALVGARRSAHAVAKGATELAEVPIGVFERALARSGDEASVERERRALRRSASRDLLSTVALARELSDEDFSLLLDGVRWSTVPRQGRIFRQGERADAAYLVVGGLVQLQSDDGERVAVRAYVSRGDLFGDEETLAGARRTVHAVALGDCQLLAIPRAVLASIVDRNPELVPRLRRVTARREAEQRQIVGRASERSTQHVFHDLYRLQMARSLLAIDQTTCVRCGHCAWACAETHDGIARLVRRGDKIVTQVASLDAEAKSLMLPSSCQHCENPACMIDCPTGAIGRDPEGDVFIREELCTGCGACAKACPWDNIRMAPRPGQSALVAVKCDLCRELEGPACVAVCPTSSIVRLDPGRDFAEVRGLLGAASRDEPARTSPAARERIGRVALSVAVGLGSFAWVVGLGAHGRGLWAPGRGLGFAAALGSGLACLALVAHALPKRWVSRFVRRRPTPSAARRLAGDAPTPPAPRSRLRAYYLAHVGLGTVTLGGVAVHAGGRIPWGVAGALALAFWSTAAAGVVGALAQRFVPARLARLERRGTLPEDRALEREHLFDRLHRATSGTSDLVKTLADKILVPYARAPLGPLALAASGRTLAEEERAVRARIDQLLEGRGGERLDGLGDLVRIVVELRALGVRRALEGVLRGFLPLHIVLGGILLALLALHVLSMTRF